MTLERKNKRKKNNDEKKKEKKEIVLIDCDSLMCYKMLNYDNK